MNNQNLVEDVAFIKEMIERTQRIIDPGAFFFVIWGLIIIIGNGIVPFIDQNLVTPFWLIASPIGIIISLIASVFIMPKSKFATTLSKQIGLLWMTFGLVSASILFLSYFSQGLINLNQMGFFIYVLMAMTFFATGIIYLKEYYFAGLVVVIGACLFFFFPSEVTLSTSGFLSGGSLVVLGLKAIARLKGIK